MNPCQEWIEGFEREVLIPQGWKFLSVGENKFFVIWDELFKMSYLVFIQNTQDGTEFRVPITEENYQSEISTAFRNFLATGNITTKQTRRILDPQSTVSKPDGSIPRGNRRIRL